MVGHYGADARRSVAVASDGAAAVDRDDMVVLRIAACARHDHRASAVIPAVCAGQFGKGGQKLARSFEDVRKVERRDVRQLHGVVAQFGESVLTEIEAVDQLTAGNQQEHGCDQPQDACDDAHTSRPGGASPERRRKGMTSSPRRAVAPVVTAACMAISRQRRAGRPNHRLCRDITVIWRIL